MDEKMMTIILYFDDKYVHFALPLMESIKLHMPNVIIFSYTFNLTDYQKSIVSIRCEHCFHDKMEFDPNIADEFKQGLNKENSLRFQLTCNKANFLQRTILNYDSDLYVIMDTDSLVVNSFEHLINDMKDYDVGVIRPNENKVNGGFLVVKNNNFAKEFLTEFSMMVNKGRLYYGKDQKCLSEAYKKTKDYVRFFTIKDKKYIDYECLDDSYIWSAHKTERYGSKEEKYAKFLQKIDEMEMIHI